MLGRSVVSVSDIAEALGTTPDSRLCKNAIHRLIELGWLRPLSSRGTYEFLSARGGPWSAGDPLTEARAVLARRPDFRLAVVGTGAAFLRGFSERAPSDYAVAIDKTQGGSIALAHAYRVTKTTPARIAGIPTLAGVPVSDAAQLLGDAALWPKTAGDLRAIDHWLGRSLDATDPAAATAVAGRVGAAAAARMSFLAARFGAPDVASAVAATLRGRVKTMIGDSSDPVRGRDPALGVTDHVGVATL